VLTLTAAPYVAAEIAAAGAQSAIAAARVAAKQVIEEVIEVPVPTRPKFASRSAGEFLNGSTWDKSPINQKSEVVLVLGRGPQARLERLADHEGGQISTTSSKVAKEIFKRNYSDIRKADKIVQYMDEVPTSLEEAIKIGGQYSRAEAYMINQRKDLLEKTIRKFER
jgi:hypothetical protein